MVGGDIVLVEADLILTGNTTSMPDVYGPLEGKGLIRLLYAYYRSDSSIYVTLQPRSLFSPACPAFTTFYYVWGQQTLQDSTDIRNNDEAGLASENYVTLSGESLLVLPTANKILRALCDSPIEATRLS